jgi:hypothetical protein
MTIREVRVAVPARDDRFQVPRHGALTGLRVARGEIDITDAMPGQAVRIRCVSWRAAEAVDAKQLKDAIREKLRAQREERRELGIPFPETLSEHRRHPPHGMTMRATVPPHVWVPPQAIDPIRIAVGCCRYPGFSVERRRADKSLRELLRLTRAPDPLQRPALLFMLGDQIYADRTGGLVDALSPMERFFAQHQEAFTTLAARKLFSRVPTICLPDDHEFTDGFPLGRPLLRRAVERSREDRREADHRERAAYRVAVEAVRAYQLGQLPESAWRDGYCEIRRGAVRFFILDTRTRRRRVRSTVQTMSPGARRGFARWVRSIGEGELACLATGSVILPGLFPGADPANMGPSDTMQASPSERRWLLEELVSHVAGRFVLLSGDYHLCFAGEVTLDGKRVGAAVVAPPFYAPITYANARPRDVWLDEPLATSVGTVSVHAVDRYEPQTGSGFGMLDFQRVSGRWQVRFATRMTDPARSAGRWWCREWPEIGLG